MSAQADAKMKGSIEKMSQNTKLKRKVLRTLLAMSLVYSGGIFAAENLASAATITTPQHFGKDSAYSHSDYECNGVTYKSAQVFDDDIDIDAAGTGEDALSLITNYNDNTALITKGDVRIKAAEGKYALLAGESLSGNARDIIINLDGDKTVQITGDIAIYNYHPNGVLVNLASADSYWAGKLVNAGNAEDSTVDFDLRLSDQAVWYAAQDSFKNAAYGNLKLTSDGGIIDLYHSQPGTARTDVAPRTFEITGDDKISVKNTTFVLGADVTAKTTDEVKLLGTNKNSGETVTNYIQLGELPREVSSKYLETPLEFGKAVVTLDGTSFTTANTLFEGKTISAAEVAADAGLTLIRDFSITPDLAADGDDTWKIDTITFTGTASKGAAMTLTESGAAAAAAVLQANSNDLTRRLGELRGNVDTTGAWARVYGGENEITGGVQTDLKYRTFQGGYDWSKAAGSGKLVTGVAVSYMKGESSFDGGSGDARSTMFGLYGSYIGGKGHYADFTAKYGRISNAATTAMLGTVYKGDFDSNAFTVSAEYGYRRELPHEYFIEPQAELTYGNMGSCDYVLSSGAKVHNDTYKSLIGRVGLTLGRQYAENNVYVKCSLAHEFQGDMNIAAGYQGVSKNSNLDLQDTWLEYGVGFNAKLDKNVNLYGELERSTGSEIKTKWRGNLGLRCTF